MWVYIYVYVYVYIYSDIYIRVRIRTYVYRLIRLFFSAAGLPGRGMRKFSADYMHLKFEVLHGTTRVAADCVRMPFELNFKTHGSTN
jgi:hypothetical protein